MAVALDELSFGGLALGTDSISHSRTANEMEVLDGLNRRTMLKNVTGSYSTSLTITDWYGICDSSLFLFNDATVPNDPTYIVDSISVSETEEHTSHESSIQGVDPAEPHATAATKSLVYIDRLIFLRTKKVMTVTGFGELPDGFAQSDMGQLVYFYGQPAVLLAGGATWMESLIPVVTLPTAPTQVVSGVFL